MRSPFSLLNAQGSRLPPVIHLGDEPAIESDGQRHSPHDHRRVSIRWLAGTILTGLSGAGLIGAAAFAALDQRGSVAEAPTLAQGGRRNDDRGDATVNTRKADRLVKSVDIVAAKQTFRAPTTVRVGDKDVVRSRSYANVSTPLTLVQTGLVDDIPPFDPLKLLASARNTTPEPLQEASLSNNEAEVSFVTRPLAAGQIGVQPATLSAVEAQAQVNEYLKAIIAAGTRAALPLPPQLLLMRTSRATLDSGSGLAYANVGSPTASTPFTSIEVKMVPENVSLVPRSSSAADRGATVMDEKLAIIRKGESIDDVLRANGVARPAAASVVSALGGRLAGSVAQEGRRVKLLFADLDGSGKSLTLARLSIYSEDRIEAMVAVTDDGRYVQVTRADSAKPEMRKPKNDDEDDADANGLRLYDSLYETAVKQEIPRPVIDELVRVFANDVDFQRPVAGGDSFTAFYEEGDEADGRNTLLSASITARGETYRYYRFVTADDGLVDFYDENGRSTRKFLVRQPIGNARITSGFGSRYHPILGYTKVHTGVDFAAPIGTPIISAGNGTIISIGWDSGYGRRIELQHANGYITTYNHMSGFARGLADGSKVRQGQVIGFVGSTGLSTGAHLHYEVTVNGHFVDPMRVKLARTREFDGRLLGDFKRERERIEALMSRAPNATRVAARNNSGG